MEKLIKSTNGQWALIKSSDDEHPYTEVKFHDGSKKKFSFRHEAVSHLMLNDYFPHGEKQGNTQHFQHLKEPNKTAEVTTYSKHKSSDDENKNTRRSTDKIK